MLKRCISLLIAVCLISGFGISAAFAEEPVDEASVYLEESQSVSGDGEGYGPAAPEAVTVPEPTSSTGKSAGTNTASPSTAGTVSPASSDANTGSLPQVNRQSFDGTNADGTLNAADGINTNLIENSSKYNGMASLPIPEQPALSRYSTSRITVAPDIAGTQYEEAAELLGALGIMVGDAEDGAFRPSDPIIRSEMAKVAVYSVGLEDIAKSSMGTTRFPDVPVDHWATGAINVADQQGMVIGDDVGTFRPNDNVLLQEAVTIIVRAMGYEPAAEDKGGYPSGYMYIASSNQLLRGLSGSAAEPATRGDIAQLVFNALTVNLMEQVGFGTNVSYEVVDKTLLYDKLNVEKGYGQITGTAETALDGGSTTDEDRIVIDKKQFLEGDTNAKQYLGYNVLYYARIDKTTDEKTLIDVRPQSNKNKTITANSDDIVNVTGDSGQNKSFEYWANRDDRTTKTATIAADAVYIYNGKYKTGVTNEALKPTSGNVILLDADTNGIYEIVFVNHFTNLVVDTVSTVTGRVTDKYMNGSLVFDEESTDVMYSLVKDGAEIGIEDLKEWNVISYTISDDKTLIKGYVSDASINGMVTEATEEGFRIGNSKELHKKADSYPNEIQLRDKGTFYLDIEGKIAAVDTNANVNNGENLNKKYAYLVGAAMNDGFDTTAQFKIFTMSGETQILNSGTKMRLNDKYGMEPKTVVDTLGGAGLTPQLIVYETNSSDNITAIETAKDNTSTGAPNVGEFTMNIKKDAMVYKSASGKLDNVAITDDTVIFDIPKDAATDTDKYSIRNKATLSNDSEYNAIVYDLQENYTANVVIITSSAGVTAPESSILVVDYISATQNEEYEDTDRLYGWQDGKEINLLAADKSILLKGEGNDTPLAKGDIIQYRTNIKGEIDGINVLFDISEKETEFIEDVTTELTTVYGKVTKKFSGSVNMSVNDAVHNYATGDATVYLYDSARNKGSIQVVSPADIEIYEEGNEARLFLKIYDDVVQEMVIIK
ncbi:S-layer homology domain-containing protein [Ructibacterium gallinarum]|uniref:S-layer homology domain-containing protein n=1 Tax=Ructibacterium gallinarum TaxID=2779355 RepID=A0A9D5M3C7_9FIRM|nr:S-layer homology domain-containing protein [Ructibacterium gallinarum]MBE5039929.1 S-layer homology domain-containing protein [Ructibacterium gallinarum]